MTSDSSTDSSKRRRLNEECYGSYTTSQLSDLFLAALFEDTSDDIDPLSLKADSTQQDPASIVDQVVEDICFVSSKRKRDISPSPPHIDLTSDGSQEQIISITKIQNTVMEIQNISLTEDLEEVEVKEKPEEGEYDRITDLEEEEYDRIIDLEQEELQEFVDEDSDEVNELDDTDEEDQVVDTKSTTQDNTVSPNVEDDSDSNILSEKVTEKDMSDFVSTVESLLENPLRTTFLQQESMSISSDNVEIELNGIVEDNNLDLVSSTNTEISRDKTSYQKENNSELIDDEETNPALSVEKEFESNISRSPNVSLSVDRKSEDSDDDVFYDVEFVDLDSFEESVLDKNENTETNQILETDPVERDVQMTQVKNPVLDYDVDLSSNFKDSFEDNTKENRVEDEEVFSDPLTITDSVHSNNGENIMRAIENKSTRKPDNTQGDQQVNELDSSTEESENEDMTDSISENGDNSVNDTTEEIENESMITSTTAQRDRQINDIDSSTDESEVEDMTDSISKHRDSNVNNIFKEIENESMMASITTQEDQQVNEINSSTEESDNEEMTNPINEQRDNNVIDVTKEIENESAMASTTSQSYKNVINMDDTTKEIENRDKEHSVIAQEVESVGDNAAKESDSQKVIEIVDSIEDVENVENVEDVEDVEDMEDMEDIEFIENATENVVESVTDPADPMQIDTENLVDMDDVLPLIENEEMVVAEPEVNEEMPFSLPESLPIPHENTQIVPEHWREEEMKLKSTYELPHFTEFNKNVLELKDILADDKSLTMWWYDACEENKKTVFLFGKVFHAAKNKYASCCMIVENLQREMYVLPRPFKLNENGDLTEEIVTIDDVKSELVEKLANKEINQYSMEVCTKKYAFELSGIPPEAEYIKLCYPYKDYKFPQGTTGRTFSHMFGTSVSAIEHFLIRQKLMGPCWLKFENVAKTSNANSWCKIEALITNPDDCTVVKDNLPSPPPLTIMSLSLHTFMNYESQSNEISAIGGFVCPNADIDNLDTPTFKPFYRFSITTKNLQTPDYIDDEQPLVNISKQEYEQDLIYAFLAQLQVIDPDIIVGHNFTGVDLDILLHRMKKLKIVNWSRIGRKRRERWPKLQAGAGGSGKSSFAEQLAMCGRLLCDTYLASQDLVKSKSYHLTQLALSQLNITREDFDKRDPKLYNVNGSKELEIARHCSFDAYLSFALAIKLQILPLTKRLTNLSGNLWSRSMNGGRSERNEYLLLHTFNEQNYICPDQPNSKKKNSSSFSTENQLELETSLNATHSSTTPSYAGGLVLEPKIGFYDKYVLLLDFNSLYPSIMQEYNICFTTVDRKPENLIDYREVPSTPDVDCPEGILPGLVRLFVQRRQQVKKLMKDHNISKSTRMQYDIEQMALKLTANSMYGCLGSSISRFYARPLAMLITHKGREILRETVDSAEQLGFNVIYGDTDSIMIYTNETKMSNVNKIGEKMKEHVNKKYKLLEIDVDGYFRHTLLLKKKKYAALLVKPIPTGGFEEFVEVKGLDLVRRDWCELSHMISNHILQLILSDESREAVVNYIHKYLKKTAKQIYNNEFPLNDFIIRKQLTKNLEEYNSKLSHPHVHVAKEMRRQGVNIKSGDVVPYVICSRINEDGKVFNEPCIPDLCSTDQNGSRNIDLEWYLSKQILPPVNRLCGPIEGIDLDSLMECVGLSKNKIVKRAKLVNTHSSQEDEEVDPDLSIYMEDSRYSDPEALYFNCNRCFLENKYTGPLKTVNMGKVVLGLECEGCKYELNPVSVRVKVQSSIIHYIRKYYSSRFLCDQVDCNFTTHIMHPYTANCPLCAGGLVREYSAKMLYMQLFEMLKLFDTSRIDWDSLDSLVKDTIVHQMKFCETYDVVKDMICTYLNMSEYNFIDLYNILQT